MEKKEMPKNDTLLVASEWERDFVAVLYFCTLQFITQC